MRLVEIERDGWYPLPFTAEKPNGLHPYLSTLNAKNEKGCYPYREGLKEID